MLAAPAPVSGTLAVGAAFAFMFRRSDVLTSRSCLASSCSRSGSPPMPSRTPDVQGALLTQQRADMRRSDRADRADRAVRHVLAARLGVEEGLMASITGETLLAILTLPLLVA